MFQSTMKQESTIISNDRETQSERMSDEEVIRKKQFLNKPRYLVPKNIFSKLFFTWISSLLGYGHKNVIDQQVIPQLINEDKPKIQFDKLYNTFLNTARSPTKGLSLSKAIFNTFKKQFMLLLFFTTIYTLLQIGQPILTNRIIVYIQSENRQIETGIIYFIAIILVTLGMSLMISQVYYSFAIIGFNLSNTLGLLLYNKTLKYPLITEKQFTVSDIVNYSQVDSQRMTYLGFQLIALILTPIQIIVMMFLLYLYIGVVFLVGVGIMIAMMVFTLLFTKIVAKANDELLKKKDIRTKVSQQILSIIKFLKINAYEKYFFKKLNKTRETELKYIKKVNFFTVLTIFVYWFCPSLIVSITFLVYTKIGNQITASMAFTVIILFNILQYPIRLLPTSISQLIQIWSSIKRIQHFLVATEIQNLVIKYNQLKDEKYTIQIENGNFLWGAEKDKEEDKEAKKQKQVKKQKENQIQSNQDLLKQSLISQNNGENNNDKIDYIHVLKNINIKFSAGEVTMIIGDIGSGKSSLLYAILNEMSCQFVTSPSIHVYGSIAFCPQKPWIMSGTVKDNILFSLPYNKERFDDAIYYACLTDDIGILGNGIETQIGEKGINLSGGQKARVSLARALYSNRDIYLLDDVLSAVDVNVGKFLMEKTILGYLRKRTVIMPTHAVHYAQKVDNVVIMSKGRIIQSGPFDKIKQTQQFKQIQEIMNKKHGQKVENEEQSILKEQKMIKQAVNTIKKLKEDHVEKENISYTDKLVEELIIPEDRKKGKVDKKVYLAYIKLNGGWKFLVLVIGCISGWAILSTFANIQIQHWCQSPENSNYHIYWYLLFSILATFCGSARAMILVMSGVRQGRILHKRMAKSLLYASIIRFYNRVPIGRILNRLTKDLREVDEQIGFAVGNLLVNLFQLLSGIAICLYASTPYIIIPCIILAYIVAKLGQYYLQSQRQCIRLQKISSSPIVSGFTSAVNGVGTIRAYNVQKDFISKQIDKIGVNKRNRIARQAMESWFSLRLGMLSFIINMCAIGYSILSGNQNGALAGLLLTYSLSINQNLVDTIFSYAYIETKMIAIERVDNFTKIQPQDGYVDYCKDWWTKDEGYNNQAISNGEIKFQNFSVKYRKDLPTVLNNININIKPCEKIGIAGRTGAGKSTLINCILRILEPTQGQIIIDGKNILEYELKDLRSCITMIDQEPTLIQGSFRENLNPTHQYSQDQLINILKQCKLWELVVQKGGLDTLVNNQNLSVGERQLICICRAFLKNSKIVLIDEATANIDLKTDQLIQEVIQTKFKNSTVLTIAHRLSTIKNSDKILILEQGKVIEWDQTQNLLNNDQSIFSKMCNESDKSYLS